MQIAKKLLTTLSILLIATSVFAEIYTVERVIDGDTLKLINGEEVQLIGIKAPEDEKMGQIATDFVKVHVKPDSKVRLEYDIQERDKYGRWLAYVYVSYRGEEEWLDKDNVDKRIWNITDDYKIWELFLNAVIVKQGLATPMTIPPNVTAKQSPEDAAEQHPEGKYADLFKELFEEARVNKRGMWAKENEDVVSVDYEALAETCEQRQKGSCCMTSVRVMKENNYFPIPTSGCPEGFQGGMLRCVTSFKWCQPVESMPRKNKTEKTIDE